MSSKGVVLKGGSIGALLVLLTITALEAQPPRRVSIDDLMALRTINDVKISPAGDQIAYTVSTPSVTRNAHEPALFIIPSGGGTPKQLAETYKIFTPSLPAPRVRWRADGQTISLLVVEKSGPQVLSIKPDNTFYEPQQERAVMQRNFDWMLRFIRP
jgi:hypothetical protein